MGRVARGGDEEAAADQELLQEAPDAFVIVDDEEVDVVSLIPAPSASGEVAAHVGVHHRLEHGAEAAHGLRPRLAVGVAHPGALRVGQFAFQRLARGGEEEVAFALVLAAHAAVDEPVLDQRAEDAVQAIASSRRG